MPCEADPDGAAASEAAAADAKAGAGPATHPTTAHPTTAARPAPGLPAGPVREIVILIESTSSFAGEDVPPPAKGTTRMEVLHGGLVVTPKCVNDAGGTGTHLELCLKIDPKLQYMPSILDLGLTLIEF